MKEDKHGRGSGAQVAVEFILVLGVVLLIVVVITPTILKEQELNKALAAAMDGALFGASMRGMGYEGEGVTEVPEGVVKIEKVEPEYQGKEGTYEWYRLRFYVDMPGYMNESSSCTLTTVGSTITNQALTYISYAFSGTWPSGTVSNVYTDRFKFTAACDFV